MKYTKKITIIFLKQILLAGTCLSPVLPVVNIFAQENSVTIDWKNITMVSRTTPTLQVVENPMLHKGSPIFTASFDALKKLQGDYVRYVPWCPYPKMAVAELKAPTATQTFWDFSYADSTMDYFMQATEGHSRVINFSTTPVWMWKTKEVVKYPDDPYEVDWNYNQGTVLRDSTLKEVSAYFARLFSWYTKGGFTDELGKFHPSSHHYKIDYWEVLNEPDLEHNISPQLYTRIYDAVVTELKKISPATKFIGISVAFSTNPEWFEYFLNPKNHRPGIPLDGIPYHHYSTPFPEQTLESHQYTFFEKATSFLEKVRYIENIRKRLSPKTITTINEIRTILSFKYDKSIPDQYWSLSGAMYAYIFLELTKMGIDVAGESQLVGYPTQFPDVSMMNWKNGNPNARYWVLKVLMDNFGKGDRLVTTSSNNDNVIAQAMITGKGKRLLLINKMNAATTINLPPGASGKRITYTDATTGEHAPEEAVVAGTAISLKPFAVAVVQLD